MKFLKDYKKLDYPVFTTIRENKGYYQTGKVIKVTTPVKEFYAEILAIRNITLNDITSNMAMRDADCSKEELQNLMKRFYKDNANNLILLTLCKTNFYAK